MVQGDWMGGLNTEISLDPEIADAWSGIRVEVVDSETARARLKCDAAQGIPPEVLEEIVATSRRGESISLR